jgi:putative flippase GtrA
MYWVLRDFMPAAASNSLALLVTAVANTAANRRLTFGILGREGRLRDYAGGLLAFGLALVLTNMAIMALSAVAPTAPRSVEIVVLIAANAVATGVRFLVLRTLLFHLRNQPGRQPS